MKLLFLVLVAANLALFAWQRGAFGPMPESGREPGRLTQQIEPDKVRALTPAEAQTRREQAQRMAALPAGVEVDLSAGIACVEFGDFAEAQVARVRPRLEALALPESPQTRPVELPGWTMVYVPPFKTRAEAERAAARMREQGVRELVVMGENTALRFGIALGSFRTQEAASKHVADLAKMGVTGARMSDKPSTLPGVRFVLRSVSAAAGSTLLAMQQENAGSRLTACTEGR